MKTEQIHIRDPFILNQGGCYRMYGTTGGTSFKMYKSEDLETWSEPTTVFSRPDGFWAGRDYWAPEVHIYGGKYYMFASFRSPERMRGTQVLVSDSPDGMFAPITELPVTPPEWMCLDGTLYVEDGVPYIVFCHEWIQVKDGEICAQRLSPDLKEPVGEPRLLFKASSAQWTREIKPDGSRVTDGPCMRRLPDGSLIMLWSSFGDGGYGVGLARSSDGTIHGSWANEPEPVFSADGGHVSLFETDSGLKLALHSPNSDGNERPHFYDAQERGGKFTLIF